MNFVACTAGLNSHVMLSGVKGACQGACIGSSFSDTIIHILSYIIYTGRSHHDYLVLQKDVHDHVLSIVTGNMEGSAAMGIDCIRL